MRMNSICRLFARARSGHSERLNRPVTSDLDAPALIAMKFRKVQKSGALPRSPGRARLLGLAHLRLQVVLQADLADQVDLGLEEVDVLFGVVQDLLQQVARDVVAHAFAVGDAGLDRGLGAGLGAQVALENLGDVFADLE